MIPAPRDRVFIKGRDCPYFVLNVNRESGYADLVDLKSATLIEEVPFDKILSLRFF